MGMLDRIKKRQFDGFKEFVLNMETTGAQTRVPIFTAGILEDPLFMSWVMKNLKTIDDFLILSSDDINAVLASQDQMLGLFAKCMHGEDQKKIMELETVIPRYFSRLRDEIAYLKEVGAGEKESARFYMVKVTRKLQMEEKIQGFPWKLPSPDIFYSKVHKDGPGMIVFESGVLAAEGEYAKGRRSGFWRHNYENGKVLAEGDYLDGLKAGKWVFYYGNGSIKSEGKYKSDLRNGMWKEWDRSGNLTEVEYLEGSKVEKS